MKINLLHSLFHAACKGKNKMVMVLLVFTMVVTGIAVPGEVKAEEVTVSIYAHSWNFNIQDKDENILFETIGGELTQLNTEKIEYELWRDSNAMPPKITQTLHITGIDYFVINCKDSDSSFDIYIPNKGYEDIWAISGKKIIISNGEITTKIPTTKIYWKKVKKAERYAVLVKRRDLGYVVEGGKPFAYTKKTKLYRS